MSSIGSLAFSGCTELTSVNIPDGLTSIGGGAFSGCIELTSVNIPNSVTSIGSQAFQDCTGLTSVNIGVSATRIEDNAFSGCTGLTSVVIPFYITPSPLAFRGCTRLTSVTIPDSVTNIAEYTFLDCTGLASVTLGSSVTSIGYQAFYNCPALASLSIPDSVTSIQGDAFRGCTGLTSVTIGKGATRLGSDAFGDCTSLATISFAGNAPALDSGLGTRINTLVYYLEETIGWSSTFGGLTTVALGPPIISEQPFSVVANLGDAVEFSVLATSSVPLPLTYQWKKNGIVIKEATTAKLSVNSVQGNDAGIYSVVITNRYGSVRSSSAGLALSQGNLYTQAQVDAAYRTGFGLGLEVGGNNSGVLANPNQYGLYSLSQVQAINVGTPLLTRDLTTGKCKLTVGVQKSSDLVNFIPMVIPEGSAVINSQGEIEFEFNSADSAAFFRVEAK